MLQHVNSVLLLLHSSRIDLLPLPLFTYFFFISYTHSEQTDGEGPGMELQPRGSSAQETHGSSLSPQPPQVCVTRTMLTLFSLVG